jgi:hypothetical protein
MNRHFNSAQIHALAVDFHNVIGPTEMLERTVGQEFSQIGGDENAKVRVVRVGAKSLCRQGWLTPITLA